MSTGPELCLACAWAAAVALAAGWLLASSTCSSPSSDWKLSERSRPKFDGRIFAAMASPELCGGAKAGAGELRGAACFAECAFCKSVCSCQTRWIEVPIYHSFGRTRSHRPAPLSLLTTAEHRCQQRHRNRGLFRRKSRWPCTTRSLLLMSFCSSQRLGNLVLARQPCASPQCAGV